MQKPTIKNLYMIHQKFFRIISLIVKSKYHYPPLSSPWMGIKKGVKSLSISSLPSKDQVIDQSQLSRLGATKLFLIMKKKDL